MNLLIRPNVRRRRPDSTPNTHAQAALGITLRKILRGRRAAGITALECARVYAAKTPCQFREHGRQQIFTLLNSRCAARFRASNGRTIKIVACDSGFFDHETCRSHASTTVSSRKCYLCFRD